MLLDAGRADLALRPAWRRRPESPEGVVLGEKWTTTRGFTVARRRPYTLNVALSRQVKRIAAVGYLAWSGLAGAWGQEAPVKPAEKPAETAAATEKKPELPFQIQLLETHIRFEANGDSRKEVHTIVKINNIL